MRVYKGYDSGDIEELGSLVEDNIPEMIDGAVNSLGSNDYCIGIYRSEKDFMEVRPVGNEQFLIWSDRIIKHGNLFKRLMLKAHIEKVVNGRENAISAINLYVNGSREEFEQCYT